MLVAHQPKNCKPIALHMTRFSIPMPLKSISSTSECRSVGVARTSADFPSRELVQRKLIETLSNFNKGNSESRILGAH